MEIVSLIFIISTEGRNHGGADLRLSFKVFTITIEVKTNSWVGSAQFRVLNVYTTFHSILQNIWQGFCSIQLRFGEKTTMAALELTRLHRESNLPPSLLGRASCQFRRRTFSSRSGGLLLIRQTGDVPAFHVLFCFLPLLLSMVWQLPSTCQML